MAWVPRPCWVSGGRGPGWMTRQVPAAALVVGSLACLGLEAEQFRRCLLTCAQPWPLWPLCPSGPCAGAASFPSLCGDSLPESPCFPVSLRFYGTLLAGLPARPAAPLLAPAGVFRQPRPRGTGVSDECAQCAGPGVQGQGCRARKPEPRSAPPPSPGSSHPSRPGPAHMPVPR